MHTPFSLLNSIQQYLIPHIEENIAPLSWNERRFVRVAELAAVDRHLGPYRWAGFGRKPKDRKAPALAFIAKAVWNLPTTLALIDYVRANASLRRLCGWGDVGDIPSESTFSRAFGQFAEGGLADAVHEGMVWACLGNRPVCHVSTDASAIECRERPAKKDKAANKGTKGPRPKRLDVQTTRGPRENLADLPSVCDRGTKRGPKGCCFTWVGYKLHADVGDGDLPISLALTGASLHDSQAAIPLMQMSSGRVTYFYGLADSAYDARRIRAHSRLLGHVPIIEVNGRGKDAEPMCPAQKVRFRERVSAERFFSNLKDNYGGRHVRVRGASKVMAHLMFGVVALMAEGLFRMLGCGAGGQPAAA